MQDLAFKILFGFSNTGSNMWTLLLLPKALRSQEPRLGGTTYKSLKNTPSLLRVDVKPW